TLSFTEVNDGTGAPAQYDVRYAASPISWGSAPSVAQGTCATPVAGSAIGAARSCSVLGLSAATAYDFELIAFRGTMNLNAIYGPLSNVASGSTAGGAAPDAGALADAGLPDAAAAPDAGAASTWPNEPAGF